MCIVAELIYVPKSLIHSIPWELVDTWCRGYLDGNTAWSFSSGECVERENKLTRDAGRKFLGESISCLCETESLEGWLYTYVLRDGCFVFERDLGNYLFTRCRRDDLQIRIVIIAFGCRYRLLRQKDNSCCHTRLSDRFRYVGSVRYS